MKHNRPFLKSLCLLVFAFLLTFAVGCEVGDVHKYVDPGDFEEYTAGIFKSLLEGSELNLHFLFKDQTKYGFESSYEPRLPKPSASSSMLGDVFFNLYFGAVKNYDYSKLNFDQKMTYNVLVDLVDIINDNPTNSGYITNDYLGSYLGYQTQLPLLLSEYKFYDEEDITNYIKFIDLIPETFQAYFEFELEKADKGFGMPDYVITNVINQCSELLANISNHFLITTFPSRVEKLSFLSPTQKQNYIALNEEKINGPFKEGYSYLWEHLPSIRGLSTNNLGLYYYKDNQLGTKVYEKAFMDATGYKISSNEAITYIETKLDQIVSRIRFLLTTDPTVANRAQAEIYSGYDNYQLVEANKLALQDYFPEISYYPDLYITQIDPSMENHFSPAAYMTSPIDDNSGEYVYINEAKIAQQENSYRYTTLAHEAIYGHMYQNLYFKSLDNVNLLRRVLKSSGYVEGWATYVEQMSYKYLPLDPNAQEYLELTNLYNGVIYCRIDLGIHAEGWDAQYISNYVGVNYSTATAILQQLVEVYTNPQTYFFSYLKIVDMRNKYLAAYGNDVEDYYNFHELFLNCGPVPLRYVEDVVSEAIKKAR